MQLPPSTTAAATNSKLAAPQRSSAPRSWRWHLALTCFIATVLAYCRVPTALPGDALPPTDDGDGSSGGAIQDQGGGPFDHIFSSVRLIRDAPSSATTDDIAAAVASRQPAVWRQSFVQQWRALRSWDSATLATRVPWMVAREQRESEFVLTAPQRGGSAPLLQGAPPWEPLWPTTRNVSVVEVLSTHAGSTRSSDIHNHRHYYYSGSLGEAATAHWQTEGIKGDLAPTDAMYIDDVPPLDEKTSVPRPPPSSAGGRPANRTSLRLWLTSGDVLARTHYDKSHNLLCVLRGRKRVLLWPPSELPSLHFYPAVHAAHRQSQVSLQRLESVSAALAAGEMPTLRGAVDEYAVFDPPALLGASGGLRAELGAGDVLYIPPYWAHAVYSPEPSVALAAFSTSWEQARWARSGWVMAPLGRFAAGGVCSKARGAAVVIAAFLHACTPVLSGSPREFLAHLWASRFAPLYGPLHATEASQSHSTLAIADCLGVAAHTLAADAPERDMGLRHRLREYAATVAAILTQPDDSVGTNFEGRRFTPGIATELAADNVEELLGWACGADGAWRLLRLLAITEEFDGLPS